MNALRSLLCVALLPLGIVLSTVPVIAAPASTPATDQVAFAPDWMSQETAGRLALGFQVLVPSWVPAPFGGEPAVTAGGGAYELYWMIAGGPPTFLHVTGTVGGTIPDFSWYDRNIQLTVNASVQGYPAYHDVTPIYDMVYWQIGDVVYSVSSQNMTGTDTLTLANSLTVLETAVPVDPGPVDPGPVDPEPVDPEPVDPVPVDPGPVEPLPTDPEVDPGPVDTGSDDTTDLSEDASVGSAAAGDDAGASSGSDIVYTTELGVTFGIPVQVVEGQIVNIYIEGVDDGHLTVGAGELIDTGETVHDHVRTGTYQWRAPEVTANTWVRILLVDNETREWLAVREVMVRPASASERYPGPYDDSDGTDGPENEQGWKAD